MSAKLVTLLSITNEQLETLQKEAISAGDTELARHCESALLGELNGMPFGSATISLQACVDAMNTWHTQMMDD